jgi:serine/threonine-protein kinase
LGFSSGDKLKKVPLAGGPSVTITNTAVSGASWAPDGTIYFGSAGNDSGLFKVTATGGEPQKLTTLDPKHNEIDHRFPEILPGGRALLFVLRNAEQPSFDNADIAALSLATGERKILIKTGTHPHYVATGHLLFLRAGVLLAVPFDPVRLEVKGAALPVAENILENPRIGAGQYAVSQDGLLVYIPGGVTYGDHELVFVDKAGNARSLTAAKRPYEDFSISPNGHFIATTIEGPVTDTWIHDIDRDTEARFTFGVENRDPTRTPDGKHIAYSGYRDGKYRIFWKPIDGSGPEETLLASDNAIDAWFWTPDGRALLYVEYGKSIGQNIGMLPMDDPQHPRLLFPQQYSVESARVSPDGKLIAFNGDESGRSEVYIAPFPSLAPRERISTDGGMHPMWSPDGRELYYRTGINTEEMEHRALAQRTRVMAVPIETEPILKVGKPRLLFEGPYFESGHDIAVTPDGRGFILIRESDSQSGPNELRVVLHWFEELKQRVPAVR